MPPPDSAQNADGRRGGAFGDELQDVPRMSHIGLPAFRVPIRQAKPRTVAPPWMRLSSSALQAPTRPEQLHAFDKTKALFFLVTETRNP